MAPRAAALLCGVAAVFGGDPTKPHFHGPTRTPFDPKDDIAPPLKSADLAKLADGEIITVQSSDATSGGGCAVEDIRAPPDVVWSQLLTFETYPDKVPKVRECANYEVTKSSDEEVMKTRYGVKVVPGLSMEYYLRHVFHPRKNALTWTLDYEKQSDIDDCHGIWRVVPHPERPEWSRVEYAADLKLRGGCPQFVIDILTKKALVDACTWLKVESEKQYAGEVASGRGAAPSGPGGFPKVFVDAPRRLFDNAGEVIDDVLGDIEQGVVDLGNSALKSATDALSMIPGFRERVSAPLRDLTRAYNDVPGPDPVAVPVAQFAPKGRRWLRKSRPADDDASAA